MRITFVCLLLLLPGVRFVHAEEPALSGFDEYVTRALKDWEVPGVAIAIVKDDTLIFSRGYGVRRLGDEAPVDERTLFAIGSATKAFTAATVAMLVDEGKIKWDDRVTAHLPWFELFDPYVTREISVRDLLCHRVGLDRGDLLWYGSELNRREIIHRVRHLKPSSSLRSRFGYQNIMYLAAGELVAEVSGKSWDEFLKERVLIPLGMNSSGASINDLKVSNNVASPHARIGDAVRPVAWRNIDNVAPAGSINSNVVEMSQWVRLQLSEGKHGERQLISSGAVREMHMPQIVLRVEGVPARLNPETKFMTYGLGWFVQDYRGRRVVQHGGNIDGMSALVAMIPEERLGFVVLANMNGAILPIALMYRVFDAFLGAPARDWSAELLAVFKSQAEQAAGIQKKVEEDRVKDTTPSFEMDRYAGTYVSEMYGEARVRNENGRLVITRGPAFTGDLEHWHYDTFRITWRDPMLGKSLLTFTVDSTPGIDELRMVVAGSVDLSFKRKEDGREGDAPVAMDQAELMKFAGRYEMKTPPVEISIEMIGGQLKLVVPGQPAYTLTPLTATRFRIEGAPAGFFVEFEVAENRVKSMSLEQGPAVRYNLTPKQ